MQDFSRRGFFLTGAAALVAAPIVAKATPPLTDLANYAPDLPKSPIPMAFGDMQIPRGMFMISTRWHEDDLYDIIASAEKKDRSFFETMWEIPVSTVIEDDWSTYGDYDEDGNRRLYPLADDPPLP